MYICMKEKDYKEWLMQLWSLTSPKICRVNQQAGDPGGLKAQFQPEGGQAWGLRRRQC